MNVQQCRRVLRWMKLQRFRRRPDFPDVAAMAKALRIYYGT